MFDKEKLENFVMVEEELFNNDLEKFNKKLKIIVDWESDLDDCLDGKESIGEFSFTSPVKKKTNSVIHSIAPKEVKVSKNRKNRKSLF